MAETSPATSEQFNIEQLQSAFVGVPDDIATGVIERMRQAATQNELRLKIRNAQYAVADIAIIAHQNFQAEVPDMFDEINWDRSLRDSAEIALKWAGDEDSAVKAAVPKSVINFAGCYFVQRQVCFGWTDGELNELLEPAGLTLKGTYDQLSQILFDSGTFTGYKTVEELRRAAPNLDILARNFPDFILAPMANEMQQDLQAKGYTLPELGPDNTYGYDEDNETYIYPGVSESGLPPLSL